MATKKPLLILIACTLIALAIVVAAFPWPSQSLYQTVVRTEAHPEGHASATFATDCFYEGEEKLGAVAGVVSTRPGLLDGHEVVEVIYDRTRLTFADLVRRARKLKCLRGIYARTEEDLNTARQIAGSLVERLTERPRDVAPKHRKFALRSSIYRYLPLSPMQATKINAALGLGRSDAERWLSRAQKTLLARIRAMLQRDPKALDGLSPPDDGRLLEAYERRLREWLSPAPAGAD